MPYSVKPLSCNPATLKGLSERLIMSHWENNYGGAVRRLNAIEAQLAELDFGKAPIKALRGGAGWVLLTYSHRDRRLVNQWAADHTHALAGGTPILALDMYEHSYQLDYAAGAEKYVDAFMQTSCGRMSRKLTTRS